MTGPGKEVGVAVRKTGGCKSLGFARKRVSFQLVGVSADVALLLCLFVVLVVLLSSIR